MKFNFVVAKPCEKYCQPASTMYDIIAEINFNFAGAIDFVGTSFSMKHAGDNVVKFSNLELRLQENILSSSKIYLAVRRENYNMTREDPYRMVEKVEKIQIVQTELGIDYFCDPETGVTFLNKGFTFLHQAIYEKDILKANEAIKKGATLDLPTKSGWFPIHLAVQKKQIDILKVLIEHGANILATTTKEGYSVLHIAANYGHREIVIFLLLHMNIPSMLAIDKDGNTALDWSRKSKHLDIAKIIQTRITGIEDFLSGLHQETLAEFSVPLLSEVESLGGLYIDQLNYYHTGLNVD